MNVLYIHVTLVPYLGTAGELKTKPTQHSIKELRSIGITADIIVCRSEENISNGVKEKLALFCDIDTDAVITNKTMPSIYQLPIVLHKEGLDRIVLKKLNITVQKPNMIEWEELVNNILNLSSIVKVALIGKYVDLHDAYISVNEALCHGGLYNNVKVEIKWINAELLEDRDANIDKIIGNIGGIVIPGGFGDRGIEGKIKAIEYARINKIPILGLCLGMQCMVIEFARNVCNLVDANSSEFDKKSNNQVIDLMAEQQTIEHKGGTMRLGIYPCKLVEGTNAYKSYKEKIIYERHRHRYEFNNIYKDMFSTAGLSFSGVSPNERLIEIVELKNHPWFLGTQFHPEFKSRPNKPHPLFKNFIEAVLGKQKKLY